MTILKNKTFLASSVSATLVILLSACGAKPAALPGITSPTGTTPSGTTAPPVSSVPQGSTSSNYTSIPYAFDLTGSSGGSTSPSVPACTNTGNHYSPSCTASGFH